MSEARDWAEIEDTEPLSLAPEPVEVRRNGRTAGLIGLVAGVVAALWLGRGLSSGALVDLLVGGSMAVIAVAHLRSLADARTPLLIADSQGVRLRLGRAWTGLPWGALQAVELLPRHRLTDARLVLVPHNLDRVLAELEPAAGRHAAWSRRLHGAPLAVPLGLSTRVEAGAELGDALRLLAGQTAVLVDGEPLTPVVEPRRRLRDPRPLLAAVIGALAGRLAARRQGDPEVAPSPTPEPSRRLRDAVRAEATVVAPVIDETGGREYRRHEGGVSLVEDIQTWGERVLPIARPGEPVAPLDLEELAPEPADDPVIGPELAAARTRLGLSVDALAERTRIRPHVIEAIEVDDFAACGGDFYARGHLRTLARILGIDANGLITSYDDRYADAPIDPRRVFEAELASGGSIRGTRGGPNWSVLVAAVMAAVLVWSFARLLMDAPVELTQPVLNGSAGIGSIHQTADPVPVRLKAVAGGAHVVVHDGAGELVWEGTLAHGDAHNLSVVPPVRLEASDAGAVQIQVAGRNRGTLGESGVPGRGTFVNR
ncbi:RodZ domain-containing protein [Nocardioides limicola]|uniref:RodZ domain-containing protein n=1 Tax=Nocardioides limicola TaxID=2803368 RepID=UPI00193C133D|nr:RodZ domain-containing protein [Nocardioides sp. DJM-14]